MEGTERISSVNFIYNKIFKKDNGFYRNIFLFAFFAAVLVHLYMFVHKFINHDDVGGLYSDCSFGLSSGRWLLEFVTGLTGNFSSSWLNGLAGSFYLATASVLIIRLFNINNYLPAVLTALSLVSFPALASNYAYMFCSSQYLFSLLFSVIGAYLIRTEKWILMPIGSVAIALAMGCYQAYFGLAAILLVVRLLLDLLEGGNEKDFKAFILKAVKYVSFLALGMIIYFIVLKMCLVITGTELIDYKGINTMGNVSLSQLFGRIIAAYDNANNFYLNKNLIFHSFFPLLSHVSFAVSFLSFIYCVISKKLWKRALVFILALLVVCVIPLASFLVYIMTEEEYVHFVMLYPAVVPLIFPAIILDRIKIPVIADSKLKKIKQKLLVSATVLLILIQATTAYEFIIISNRAYFSMDVTYENVYAFYTKLTAKIELQEGFTNESEVAFIGYAKMADYVPPTNMTGVITGNSALNIYTVKEYLMYYLGTQYNYASQKTVDEICASEEFAQMPVYPNEGSISNIDGVIVVKFS